MASPLTLSPPPTVLPVKSQTQISRSLIYFHLPHFLTPANLSFLMKTSTLLTSLLFLTFCMSSYYCSFFDLPKLNLPVGSWDYSSLINTFSFLISLSRLPLFGFWVSRSGSWGIERKSFTQEVILGSTCKGVGQWDREGKEETPLRSVLRSSLLLWAVRAPSDHEHVSESPFHQRQGR